MPPMPAAISINHSIGPWFFDGVGCVSHDWVLDLVTVQSNLNGPRYQREIRETVVVPHYDNHALVTRPVWTTILYPTDRFQ